MSSSITDCNKKFGLFLKEGRLRKDMSQTEVVERAGIGQSYYSYIEAGRRNIDLSLALNLCDILGLDINDFVKAQSNSTRK